MNLASMHNRIQMRRLRPTLWAIVTVVATLVAVAPAQSADGDTEEARLAALVRQLNALERAAQRSAELTVPDGSRYHFDYARLSTDLARVRAGIEDYLNPVRAQPRDPQTLSGKYRKDASQP